MTFKEASGAMEMTFGAITLVLWLGVFTLSRATLSGKARTWAPVIVAAGLTAQALLASRGFFEDFASIPPRLALILIPNLAMLIFFATRPGVGARLGCIPLYVLVGFQTFRILVEIILHTLVQQGRLSELMTYTGSNFDALVGLTAPFIAILLYRPTPTRLKLALAWNAAGFVILCNTLVHGVLSAPTPFQIFRTVPPTTLIAQFPWIWLPGFVVPSALLGHILSVRQIRAATGPKP